MGREKNGVRLCVSKNSSYSIEQNCLSIFFTSKNKLPYAVSLS